MYILQYETTHMKQNCWYMYHSSTRQLSLNTLSGLVLWGKKNCTIGWIELAAVGCRIAGDGGGERYMAPAASAGTCLCVGWVF